LAYPLSLVTLSPPFLIVTYVAIILIRRELTIALGLLGQLGCEAFNLVLKRIFKQGRPTDYLGTGYGMPSSHSQFVGYFAAFWVIHLLRFRPGMTKSARTAKQNAVKDFGSSKGSGLTIIGLLRSLEHYALLTMVLLGSTLTAYSRYHLSYHTALQILVGTSLGIGCGVSWYVLVEVYLRRPLFGMQMSIRAMLLDNPIAVAFRIRDSWAVWDDAGVEAEYGLWRRLYEDQASRQMNLSAPPPTPSNEQDIGHMLHALRLASKCDQTTTAFCVGCVIVDDQVQKVVATGYSRETPGNTHAEEVALDRLAQAGRRSKTGDAVVHLSLYTTMEPCSERLSRKDACVQRILSFNRAGVEVDGARLHVQRIVQAVREPEDFVVCAGTQMLQDEGLEVIHLDGGTTFVRGRQELQLQPGWLEREAVRLAKYGHADQPAKRGKEDVVWREEGWLIAAQTSSKSSTVRSSGVHENGKAKRQSSKRHA
jgi:dolichyldiphosphatase